MKTKKNEGKVGKERKREKKQRSSEEKEIIHFF